MNAAFQCNINLSDTAIFEDDTDFYGVIPATHRERSDHFYLLLNFFILLQSKHEIFIFIFPNIPFFSNKFSGNPRLGGGAMTENFGGEFPQ